MFSAIVIAGISLLLFTISVISFKRIRETKMLFIGLSFLVFFIKAIIFLHQKLYAKQNYLIILDLLIIIFLYIAAAKK